MVGLFKTLLILGGIYFLSKFLSVFFAPFFRGNINQKQNSSNYQQRREGDVNIDYIPKRDKKVSKDKGQYVDYEEVKD